MENEVFHCDESASGFGDGADKIAARLELLSARAQTQGGVAWLDHLRKIAAQTDEFDYFADGALREPWEAVAAMVDYMDLPIATAATLSPDAALDLWLDHVADRTPSETGHPFWLPKCNMLALLKRYAWNAEAVRPILALADGDALWSKKIDRWLNVHRVGNHLFEIDFEYSAAQNYWGLKWSSIGYVPPRSGLFPKAAEAFREALKHFLKEAQPVDLSFLPSDEKRAAFYAAVCPGIDAENYITEVGKHGMIKMSKFDQSLQAKL
jgi:hypothetical protein